MEAIESSQDRENMSDNARSCNEIVAVRVQVRECGEALFFDLSGTAYLVQRGAEVQLPAELHARLEQWAALSDKV